MNIWCKIFGHRHSCRFIDIDLKQPTKCKNLFCDHMDYSLAKACKSFVEKLEEQIELQKILINGLKEQLEDSKVLINKQENLIEFQEEIINKLDKGEQCQ